MPLRRRLLTFEPEPPEPGHPLTPAELLEHLPVAPAGWPAAWSPGVPLWISAPPGRGKTHCLRWLAGQAVAAGWWPVGLDLATTEDPSTSLVDLLRAAAADRWGAAPPAWEAADWLHWLDHGPGAVARAELEREFVARLGSSLREVRRQRGPEAVAELLADYAARHDLPAPQAPPPAARLAGLQARLPAGEQPWALLLDNADAADPARLAALLDALTRELPLVWGRPWRVAVAALRPPPGELAPRCHPLDLGPTAPEVLRARCQLDLSPDAWALLLGLAPLVARGLGDLAVVLRDLAPRAAGRALGQRDLLAAAPLASRLADLVPRNTAVVERLGADQPAAGELLRLLLWRAAAGLPASAPRELLDDLLPAAAVALATWPGCRLGDCLEWDPSAPDELALARALATAAATQPRHAGRDLRYAAASAWLADWPRQVVAGQVAYDGQVGLLQQRADLAAGLPPAVGWRCWLQLGDDPELPRDPRVLVLCPAPPTPAEDEFWRRGALLRQIVAEHDDSLVRLAAATLLVEREPLEHDHLTAAARAGAWLADPPLAGWADLDPASAPAQWLPALLPPRLLALSPDRRSWCRPEALAAPLDSAALAAAWDDWRLGRPSPLLPALGCGEGPCPAWEQLAGALAARGSRLALPPLLAAWTAPPVGLTPDLARWHVLAFAVRSALPLELEVRGAEGPVRLDSARLRELPLASFAPADLLALVRADGRSPAELQPYLQPLGSGPWEQQRAVLRQRLHRAAEVLDLARAWPGAPPVALQTALGRVQPLAEAAHLAGCDAALQATFGDDLADWLATHEQLRLAAELAAQLPELRLLRRLLERAASPAQPLEGDRQALLGQLDLPRLAANPSVLRGLLAQGRLFEQQFSAAWQDGHARYQEDAAALRQESGAVADLAAALERLNALAALGPPDAAAAAATLPDLAAAVSPCPAADLLDGRCQACGYRLGDRPPVARLAVLREELQAAFLARSRRLRERLTATLAGRLGDRFEALHQVLTLQSAAALPEVLTPATVVLLEACLPSPPPGPLALLRAEYPVVTAAELPALLARFEQLLRASLAGGDAVELI
ncbi:MAG: hypothetical protein IT204_17385 [Fimbriimonadaceae bacterium]|nr:hypothetical protein [Fimbriimonadaceae bacterium]